jgi:hypothetical protein
MGSRAGFSASVSAWEGNAFGVGRKRPSLIGLDRPLNGVLSDSADDQTWLN